MADGDRDRWNSKYESAVPASTVVPDDWLLECIEVISRRDPGTKLERALDLACGLGHNSIWLAQNGWDVDAVDVSDRGLQVADEVARANRARVQWIAADIDSWRPEIPGYDIALVFRFLERESTPRIIRETLRPGGWVIYETFSRAHFDRPDNHLRNLDYTLAPGELVESMFSDFDVILHRVEELKDRSVERFLGRRSS